MALRQSQAAGAPARRTPKGTPHYQRIRDSLVRRIAAGEWKPGEAVPSEQALAIDHAVAPGTARKAVDMLVQDKLLVRHQGKGTFVATFDWPAAIRQCFRMVGPDGARDLPLGRIVHHEVGPATPEEALPLQLRQKTRVIRFLRVRYFGAVPVIVERLVVPARQFPDLATGPEVTLPPALYEHYGRKYGVLIGKALENLRAVAANAEDSTLLNVPRGYPLLEIERIAFQIEGKPVEWRVSRCDTARHSYRNEIGSDWVNGDAPGHDGGSKGRSLAEEAPGGVRGDAPAFPSTP